MAKNVITGSVKSAKVGAVPMVKGMAMGVLMAFMITGNVSAYDHGDGVEELEPVVLSFTIPIVNKTVDVGAAVNNNIVNPMNVTIEKVNDMSIALDNLDDYIVLGTDVNILNGATKVAGNLTVGDNKFVVNAANGNVTGGTYNGVSIATNADSSAVVGGITLSSLATKATTLAGYGIGDAYTKTETDSAISGAVANKANKATTLEGYGITDAYTQAAADGKFATIANVSALDEKVAANTTNIEANTGAIDALEDVVGDADSGLVKSVADNTANIASNASAIDAIEDVVGDADSGLVKSVADNTANIANNATNIATLNTTVGGWQDWINPMKETVEVADGAVAVKSSLNVTGQVTATDFSTTSGTSLNTVAGQVSTLDTAYKSADNALDGRITANETTISGLNTTVTEHKTAITNKADKATTLAGYGITDAYTTEVIDSKFTAINDALSKTATEAGYEVLSKKTQNIIIEGENATKAGKTVITGDVEVGGNVKAATFNGLVLENELASKVDAGTVAEDSYAIAVGEYSYASGNGSIAIGYHISNPLLKIGALADSSIAVGTAALVNTVAENGVAIGTSAHVSKKNGLALGHKAVAGEENSIALGAFSVANEANVVSVGSGNENHSGTYQYRRIVNVADGWNDYDAVNFGQLKAYTANAQGLTAQSWAGNDKMTAVNGMTIGTAADLYGSGDLIGANDGDYLIVSQDGVFNDWVNGTNVGTINLSAINRNTQNITAEAGKTYVKGDVTVNEGEDNQILIDATGITVGLNSTKMDDAGVYAGRKDTTKAHSYDNAYAAISADGRIKGAGGKFGVDKDGNVTGGTYNGVTIGVNDDGDAFVNNVNINDLETKVMGNADAITNLQAKDTDLKEAITKVESDYKAADAEIKQGISDMDAAYKAADAAIKADVKANADNITALQNADIEIKQSISDMDVAYKEADEAIRADVKANADNITALQNADVEIKQSISDMDVAYKEADEAIKVDVKANADNITALQNADAEIKQSISDMDAAYKAADAAIKADVKANADNITALQNADAEIKQSISDMETAYKAADKTLQDNIDAEVKARAEADAQTLAYAKVYADEKGSALQAEVEAGYKAADTNLQSQIDTNKRANDAQSAQISQLQSKDVEHTNAIADLGKTKADVTYVDEVKAEVEAGYKAADAQTLTDAKAYADEKDTALKTEVTEAYTKADEAIKADVKTNADNVAANAEAIATHAEAINNNTEAISGLNQRLGKMNGKINKVGAGAAALAALHPLDYDPDDKLTFAAGVGNYAGENAAALGAFYRPDEKFMVSLGGTMGNGENMVNLGVSIGLDGAKGTPKLSRKELVEKVSTMEAANEALKSENEALAARVARLERIVVALTEKEEAK